MGVNRRAMLVGGWLLAATLVAVFGSLGRWQLGRMAQKQAMLDEAAAVRAVPPQALREALDSGRGYDRVAATGRFADGPAVVLDNQLRDGRPGVRGYRVFLSDGAPPVLVELGWLPLPGDRSLPAVDHPQGEVEVRGLLAPPPSRGIGDMAVDARPDGTLLVTALDMGRLREALGLAALAPRVLKPDPDLPFGHVRDDVILPNTLPPEKHLGYAVQWFGLALAVLVTALVLTFRKPRR